MKHVIVISAVFILNSTFFSQQYFVEFIVDEINSFEKAKSLEFKLRSESDYEMVRMDFHTGRCFIILKENLKRSENHFKDELKKLEYQITCFYIGQRGKDPFVDIKRGHCY